jgi:hypothetical protein
LLHAYGAAGLPAPVEEAQVYPAQQVGEELHAAQQGAEQPGSQQVVVQQFQAAQAGPGQPVQPVNAVLQASAQPVAAAAAAAVQTAAPAAPQHVFLNHQQSLLAMHWALMQQSML